MNQLIAGLLSLKGEQLDNVIAMAVMVAVIGIYLIPLAILINDISKRYDDKIFKILLISLAVLTLPLFIMPYILFRKETTLEEDNVLESEYGILATTHNCIKCTKCSEINRSNYNYCIKCGGILTTVCKNCSLNIDLNWNHCGFCGIVLNEPKIQPLLHTVEAIQETQPEIIEMESPQKLKSIDINELIKPGRNIINNNFLKNKKMIYAIGEKINSLITVETEIYDK